MPTYNQIQYVNLIYILGQPNRESIELKIDIITYEKIKHFYTVGLSYPNNFKNGKEKNCVYSNNISEMIISMIKKLKNKYGKKEIFNCTLEYEIEMLLKRLKQKKNLFLTYNDCLKQKHYWIASSGTSLCSMIIPMFIKHKLISICFIIPTYMTNQDMINDLFKYSILHCDKNIESTDVIFYLNK